MKIEIKLHTRNPDIFRDRDGGPYWMRHEGEDRMGLCGRFVRDLLRKQRGVRKLRAMPGAIRLHVRDTEAPGYTMVIVNRLDFSNLEWSPKATFPERYCHTGSVYTAMGEVVCPAFDLSEGVTYLWVRINIDKTAPATEDVGHD